METLQEVLELLKEISREGEGDFPTFTQKAPRNIYWIC